MRLFLSLLLALHVALPAFAQDDAAAGLFTEAGTLPIVSQSVAVDIVGSRATVRLVQVFANEGDTIAQADYRLPVPQGASVTGFGFWSRGRFLEAALKEKAEAEADHTAAAMSHTPTALARTDGNTASFSVYPVEAGELKQVEITLSLPLVMDLGRNVVHLPLDSFLGQQGQPSVVSVRLRSDSDLVDYGIGDAGTVRGTRGQREARFVWSGNEPVDVWWREPTEPLVVRAATVPLDGGMVGLETTVVLHDAQATSDGRPLRLIVDGSTSMKRRGQAAQDFALRVAGRTKAEVYVVGAQGPVLVAPQSLAQRLPAAHVVTWADLEAAGRTLGCGPAVRCVVLTDPQVRGLDSQSGLRVAMLADADELAYSPLPPGVVVHQPGVDSAAHLHAMADTLVLPVLEVLAVEQGGRVVPLVPDQVTRVAEGGRVTLYARGLDAREAIRVHAHVAGKQVVREVTPTVLGAESERGRALRQGLYTAYLAERMARFRENATPELRQEIVEVSTREGIPTALTALQVDDPSLSLVAIMGGDPILTVHPEPGLTEVVAWYPFGDARRLVLDPEGTFSDRFLAPRHWEEGTYGVEVRKRFADGTVRAEQVFYDIDESAPGAALVHDRVTGRLRVVTGLGGKWIAMVSVHADDRVIEAERSLEGSLWSVPTAGLPSRFVVQVRDRAGNRSSFDCALVGGRLEVLASKRALDPAPVLPALDQPLWLASRGLAVEGAQTSLTLGDRTWRFATPALRSTLITAVHQGSSVLVGTRGGDVLEVDSAGARRLVVFPEHPVTGMVPYKAGVLIGVLGKGLYEYRDGTLRPSFLPLDSRSITGLATDAHGIVVATADAGLWRIEGPRLVPVEHGDPLVLGLESDDQGVVAFAADGRHRVERRETRWLDGAVNGLQEAAPDLTAAVRFRDQIWVSGLDRGLLRLEGDRLVSAGLPLTSHTKRVNDLVVWNDALWMATEGGVLSWDGEALRTWTSVAAHDLDPGDGLAIAAVDGLWVLDDEAHFERVDDPETSLGRFTATAWHDGALYGGTMEGLTRYDADGARTLTAADGFQGHYLTALLSDGDRLLVGTYASGVIAVQGERARTVLAGQWVPPQGLRSTSQGVWVGGMGMPAVNLDAAAALPVPVRDVVSFLDLGDGHTLFVTSDGLVRVGPAVDEVASR